MPGGFRHLFHRHEGGLWKCDPQGFRNAAAVRLISSCEVCNLQFGDTPGNAGHVSREIHDERPLLLRVHETKQIAGLAVIVTAVALDIAIYVAGYFVGSSR